MRSLNTLKSWLGAGALVLAASTLARAADEGEHAFELDSMREPTIATAGTCVIRGATVHTAVAPAEVADVFVRDGLIAGVGSELDVPSGVLELDGTGMHLAPGVIDCHSHMAIERGVNEGTLSITCDVDISDSVNADDIAIYRALAGGVTTARLLHGSANAIGGRHEVIKLRWGRRVADLRFEGAPEGVKFALGENVKQSNGTRQQTRFPSTRMGVEAVFQRAFQRAREYAASWEAYDAAVAAGEDPLPPRRDLRLDALVGILGGEIEVHSHCYRADEILMLLRTAERFGFRIKTLQHVLEGYKVAAEIAEHGAGASTFSDWWAYKVEAYDAIPYNATLLDQAGASTSLNSDSNEVVRHMYLEAAKAVKYGGLDRVRALRLVTLNPAEQLGIDAVTGSIEVGKAADLALMTHDPLSSRAVVLWTMVDGEVEFERADRFGFDEEPATVTELAEPGSVVPLAWNPNGGDTIAITGATLHPITGPDIERGTLLMQDGHIVGLGADVEIPGGARILPADGKHVWPGMVALDTSLGVYEISAVRSTDDRRELGGNQPDVRASAAINAETAHIPVSRAAGITRAQTVPSGGGPLRGQSCVIQLAGDTWEELLFVDRDMLHMNFPRTGNNAEDKQKEPPEVEALRTMFAEAREHARLEEGADEMGSLRPLFDSRLAALTPYVKGEKRVAVHVDNAQSILFAIRFIEEQELDAVLVGVSEGWKVADRIAAAGLEVVIGPVLALPRSRFDPYDSAYANAAVLHRAGVPFSFRTADVDNTRNLAHHAAMAAAFGLPREEALRGVTFYPARVLGIEDQVGSLAAGKLADVIVTDGDLLEITTNVEYVFIAGQQTSLETRQSVFRDKYAARIERMQAR